MAHVRRRSQDDTLGAPALTDICVDALIQYKRFLGDLGYVEPCHLRKILAHLTRAELECVEDMTLEGSQRDLTWWTWHLWYRIYNAHYGVPQQDELMPLPGEAPADYDPPKVDYTPADYRTMLQQREQAEADRKAAAINRLRAGYNTENRKRLAQGVEYTNKLPPPKRTKPNSPGAILQKQLAAANANKRLAGKPAVKVMKDLGLTAKMGMRPGGSSNGRQGSYRVTPTGRAAAGQQAPQPSALACLASRKPAATTTAAAVGQGSSSSRVPAAGVGRPLSSGSQVQQVGRPEHHQQRQQPQRLMQSHQQQRHSGSSAGAADKRQPAAAVKQRAGSGGGGLKQQRSSAGVGLLDTPLLLGKKAAGAQR